MKANKGGNKMDRFSFYRNIDRYKSCHNDSLEHAGIPTSYKKLATGLNNMKNYGYYNKIDNFYGPGKSRYFYTKEEWDAYQRQSDATLKKAKDEVKYAKEIKENKEKNSNVYEAQKAREQAEKKGTEKTRNEQSLRIHELGLNTDKVLDDFVQSVRTYCSGDKKELSKILSKYDVNGEMSHNNYVRDPEWQKLYNAHVRNYKSDDPGYSNANAKMQKIQNDYQEKRAREMCQDIIRFVRENATPNNLYFIMKNPYVKQVLNGDIKTYDSLARMFRSLNADQAKTWDKGETLHEDILKEDILKEDILKEDILKEDILKEKKLKEKKI